MTDIWNHYNRRNEREGKRHHLTTFVSFISFYLSFEPRLRMTTNTPSIDSMRKIYDHVWHWIVKQTYESEYQIIFFALIRWCKRIDEIIGCLPRYRKGSNIPHSCMSSVVESLVKRVWSAYRCIASQSLSSFDSLDFRRTVADFRRSRRDWLTEQIQCRNSLTHTSVVGIDVAIFTLAKMTSDSLANLLFK